MQEPKAEHKDVSLAAHGETRIDPFYWMRERENPEVLNYLRAENDYCDAELKQTEKLQDELFKEMKARIKEDDESVPYTLRGYEYQTKFKKGKEYPVFLRRKVEDKDFSVFLDQNSLAEGHDYHSLGGLSISSNNKLLAVAEDTVSRRIYTVRFKDLTTGEFLTDKLENTIGGVAWANDNKTVFYSRRDPVTLRPYVILRHVLGTSQSEDEEIYRETDPQFVCGVGKSKSEQYITISSSSSVSDEYRFVPADKPFDDFVLFEKRERGHEYDIAHYKDAFYILSNKNAPNFKLMKTPVDQTAEKHWEEVIPHREDVLLEDIDIFARFLVLTERKNGLIHLKIRSWDGKNQYEIPFNDPAYVAYTGINPDFESDKLRYGYTSLTTPPSVYLFDMNTREQELLKQNAPEGPFEASDYRSERIFAQAPDGTQVPVSLVYKVSERKPGKPGPLLLDGYGSYGISSDPTFSSVWLSLLDRGFIMAIAHIRGGEEMGRKWYEEGKMLHKMNTFTDFIACGEHLIKTGYTDKEQLFATGGSAGGLLMGAVINMRPDLWKGAVASVPFVDVLTTMLDESIPLTTGEYDEWGNPNDREYYDYIEKYSPYDNVAEQDYPHLLVLTGLHDSQVQYWEPAKWIAKLRELRTNKNKLLLHTNLSAGHGGSSGRFRALKEAAKEYAFLLDLVKK